MQIFLIEENEENFDLLQIKAAHWGYDTILTDETHLNEISATSGILLLSRSKIDRTKIIEQLRSLKLYTYIICLISSESRCERGALFEAGADEVIAFGDWGDLKYKLRCGQRLLNCALTPTLKIGNTESQERLSAINLKKMLKNLQKDASLFEKSLKDLINIAKKTRITDETLLSDHWGDLHLKSYNLATDALTDLLSSIIALKSQTQLHKAINYDTLQSQIDQKVHEIEESYQLLSEFEYFKPLESIEHKTTLVGSKILLVEDLLHNRILVKQILKKHCCEILEAENGVEAIKLWEKEHDFDLIIMDMNMPVMDGFTATQNIRQAEVERGKTKIPILALTALAMRGDEEHCLSVGCDGYIAKPVNAKILIKVCEELILKKSSKEHALNKFSPPLKIQKSLLKTKNQALSFSLNKAFNELGVELTCLESTVDLMDQLADKDFDLIVLEGDCDLHLAYEIKDCFPRQQMILVCSHTSKFFENQSGQKSESILAYPFNQKEVGIVLQHISLKLQQSQKNQDMMADVSSLKQVKSQVNIEECVQQSDSQLAVWQKAFRKIGGDLVLSRTFDFHGKFGFILADVAGHDIVSGYTASWFAGLVKGIWGHYSQPLDLLIYLNSFFAREGDEEGKRFVCALVLMWDRQRCKLYYANAGIPGGIMVKYASGNVDTIDWKGVPIGMFTDIEMFDHGEIDFYPGDRLYTATDGILEAIPSEIIINLSKEKQRQEPTEALASIVDFVTRSIEIKDDLTISLFEAHALPLPVKGFRKSIDSTYVAVDQVIADMRDFVEKRISTIYDWGMISMAAREALINAVEHGNQKKEELPIDVDIDWVEPLLEIRVSDSGCGFDLASVKKRLREEGELRIQGRGIEIIENIAHKISYLGSGIKMEFLPLDKTP